MSFSDKPKADKGKKEEAAQEAAAPPAKKDNSQLQVGDERVDPVSEETQYWTGRRWLFKVKD
jgi:hypothetical protein|tara:strand:- start:871 stop:1056 length:186 start_codon:yes stop_codon:yes gene_type:complete